MKNSFRLANTNKVDKVLFMTYMLRGAMLNWWHIEQASLCPNNNLSWSEFKGAFRRTYIPNSVMATMRHKFCELKQGSMSVLD